MSIPSYINLKIPIGKSIRISCLDEQVITLTSVSLSNPSSGKESDRTVVWFTIPKSETVEGPKIALATLSPFKSEISQLNLSINSYSPVTFSTTGTHAEITINGYSNIMYEPKIELI